MTEPLSNGAPLVRDISDTARWAAWCRAVESERPDALFRDPLARALAGDQGPAIEAAMSQKRGSTVSSLVVRTVSFDAMILDRLAEGGVDTIVNLAAGLDTRPYRLVLPSELRWIEVDLPDLVSYKEACLAGERASCQVERMGLDLSNGAARRAMLAGISQRSTCALVLTEGLLLYLEADLVVELASELAQLPAFRSWLTDLLHPSLLPFIVRSWNTDRVGSQNLPKFAPEGGPEFFRPYGWGLHHAVSAMEEAERLNRQMPGSGALVSAAQREAARTMNAFVRLDRAERGGTKTSSGLP